MNPEPATEPKVLAFDYYDGPTEGFSEHLLDDSDCYFTLIAWDSDQDDRLYAAVKIEKSLFGRVISLFGKTQDVPDIPVWIPRWEFTDTNDEDEVRKLIRLCRNRLISEGYFVLTRQIGEQPMRIVAITGDLAPKVSEVLMRGTPDDLTLWYI